MQTQTRVPAELPYQDRKQTLQDLLDLPHAKAKIDALRALEYRAGVENARPSHRWSTMAQEFLDARDNLQATIVAEAGAATLLDL